MPCAGQCTAPVPCHQHDSRAAVCARAAECCTCGSAQDTSKSSAELRGTFAGPPRNLRGTSAELRGGILKELFRGAPRRMYFKRPPLKDLRGAPRDLRGALRSRFFGRALLKDLSCGGLLKGLF
eukprot:gene15090-biopygen1973